LVSVIILRGIKLIRMLFSSLVHYVYLLYCERSKSLQKIAYKIERFMGFIAQMYKTFSSDIPLGDVIYSIFMSHMSSMHPCKKKISVYLIYL